jgi:hypothetical protein
MNRIAKSLTTVAASTAVVAAGALAAAPVASAEQAPAQRTNVHVSPRTDRVLERADVRTSPTGTARVTISGSEPTVISFQVTKKNANRTANSGGVRFQAGPGNLVFGHWTFNKSTHKVTATINKSARANFFRLKPAPSGPANKYQVVFNKLGAGQFNTILKTKTFHAGDIFGRVRL